MVNTIERFTAILKDVFLTLPGSIQAMFIFCFVLAVIVAVIKMIMG